MVAAVSNFPMVGLHGDCRRFAETSAPGIGEHPQSLCSHHCLRIPGRDSAYAPKAQDHSFADIAASMQCLRQFPKGQMVHQLQ